MTPAPRTHPMNVREALEWALDCLDSDDEVIGKPEVGVAVEYALNGVRMGRATTYAASKAEARRALASRDRPPTPPKRDLADPSQREMA